MLAARLAAFIPLVVGLDLHQAQVDAAASSYPAVPSLRFEVGDVLKCALADAPFDFVVCSATLHHVDLHSGLDRLAELTAPGGTLVIVGLATNSTAFDWLLEIFRLIPVRLARARHGWHDHGAPKLDARNTWSEVHQAVRSALPGATFRRRLYWRYSVVWERPNA